MNNYSYLHLYFEFLCWLIKMNWNTTQKKKNEIDKTNHPSKWNPLYCWAWWSWWNGIVSISEYNEWENKWINEGNNQSSFQSIIKVLKWLMRNSCIRKWTKNEWMNEWMNKWIGINQVLYFQRSTLTPNSLYLSWIGEV